MKLIIVSNIAGGLKARAKFALAFLTLFALCTIALADDNTTDY